MRNLLLLPIQVEVEQYSQRWRFFFFVVTGFENHCYRLYYYYDYYYYYGCHYPGYAVVHMRTTTPMPRGFVLMYPPSLSPLVPSQLRPSYKN